MKIDDLPSIVFSRYVLQLYGNETRSLLLLSMVLAPPNIAISQTIGTIYCFVNIGELRLWITHTVISLIGHLSLSTINHIIRLISQMMRRMFPNSHEN